MTILSWFLNLDLAAKEIFFPPKELVESEEESEYWIIFIT